MALSSSHEQQVDEFISSNEMGREIETSLSSMLKQLDSLERDLNRKIDDVGSSMDKLERTLIREAEEAERAKNPVVKLNEVSSANETPK